MLTVQHLGNSLSVRNSSHASETIVFSFAGINLVTVFFNSCFSALEFCSEKVCDQSLFAGERSIQADSRIIFNRIPRRPTTPTRRANSDSGPLGSNFAALQILDQNLFEFPDGLIVVLNQVRKLPNFSANVHTRSWVGHPSTLENGLEAFIRLELFGHGSDLQCARIEGLHMFGGAEPGLPQLENLSPMVVDAEDDEEGDDVGHDDVGV